MITNNISHIDFIKSLDKIKSCSNGEAFSYSLANEDFDCLKYVLENDYSLPTNKKDLVSNIILSFSDEDNICKCIRLLYEKNLKADINSYQFARKKSLKVLNLLYELN